MGSIVGKLTSTLNILSFSKVTALAQGKQVVEIKGKGELSVVTDNAFPYI